MFPEPRMVETNGIELAVYEQGEGPPIILLHGFPELAFSWRFQLPALAEAGYRAIAVDQRGYGRSSVPDDVDDYGILKLIDDVHGLLDAQELESAVFAGHDWGALLLWHMAQLAPERIDGLIQLNIPHFARSPTDPIELARQRLGDEFYIVNFQDSDEADRAFESNPRHFLNMMMRKDQIRREDFNRLPKEMRVFSMLKVFARKESSGQPLLTEDELDYYASAFEHSGFTGPINWYRNWTKNWEKLEGADQRIDIPTLFLGAVDDVVIPLESIEGMKPLVSDLEIHMLEPCGHWSQQEHPEEVNGLMIDWLERRQPWRG